jgi:formylglycine-generating enzyme required for sulfatase activity/tRNA A-37 threonylcarbamoyl transferase component Bud32
MLTKGTVLAERYKILREVKSGGQGAVYEAYDAKLKHRVAVKRTVAATEKLRTALEREALTLAQLRHRHLPRVTDHFPHAEHGHFLVMDFIDGDDLGCIVDNEKLPVDRVLRWAHQLLDVVEYLHGFEYEGQPKPIIHCDIKPLNLKLTKNDDIVLLDFGLASGLPTAIAGSRLRTVLGGSSGYMPYEQEQRLYEPGEDPNEKWDVYAVGATIYHLLTGFPPSPSGARAFKTNRQKPDPLETAHRKSQRKVSPALSDVIAKAMALDADDRYATIGEFRAALLDALKVEKADPNVPGWAENLSVPLSPAIVVPHSARVLPALLRKLGWLAPSFTNSIGMEFVLVPAGRFQMGSSYGYHNENPKHEVIIKASFYLGKYQVTQREWTEMMENNPSHFTGDDRLPVEHVSWNDCQEFIKKLNARNDGYVYRLPSEAEWEYACRAGTMGAYAGKLDEMAWHIRNSGFKTHRVGEKNANQFGLYDMHGNVWEWCQDMWHDSYNKAPSNGMAWEDNSNDRRVARGGSCQEISHFCRSAYRKELGSWWNYSNSGCRLVAARIS